MEMLKALARKPRQDDGTVAPQDCKTLENTPRRSEGWTEQGRPGGNPR